MKKIKYLFIRSSSILIMSIALIMLVSLTECNENGKFTTNKKNILKGTLWTSDFYHYHNNYFFETDSTGYSQAGRFAWSCSVDTLAKGISNDSILYDDDKLFRYFLKDSILTIKHFSTGRDANNDERIFHLRKYTDTIYFISEYQYSYGREGLEFKKRLDK